MFNGIIFNTGKVKKKYIDSSGLILTINSKININSKKEIGSSICCAGVCLTLTKYKNNNLSFYISKETIKRSNLSMLKINDIVNLEKPIKFGDRISGHFIQGHVDTMARVKKIKLSGKSWYIDFSLEKKFKKYLINKGSIAVNGISLTIAKVKKNVFQVAVIPHTLKLTNLIKLQEKDLANIEFDILLKYIKNN
jgi:riboflavin synthase|tara:strand:- start:583 stop:1164 length:582 start_codon:yes stop_codon:yes gene_type:complete